MKILKIISAAMIALTLNTAAAATSDYDRDSNSSSTDMSRVPVPTGKYITGGILASTVGFGIGHGIQGRYAEKGWIFTAAEAGGLAVALVGASSCKDETDIYGTKTTKCSNGALAAVGLGVMIGFHVWEIVDAWTGARPVDDGPKAFILPNPEAPGIGVAWSF